MMYQRRTCKFLQTQFSQWFGLIHGSVGYLLQSNHKNVGSQVIIAEERNDSADPNQVSDDIVRHHLHDK